MHHGWVAVAGLGAAGLLACGASGVTFSGKTQPRVIDSARVQVGDRPPAGQRPLGRLAAECTPVRAEERLDGVRLSDLSCSRDFLMAALKERAAGVGGAFLIEPRCGARGKSETAALSCSAEVWGPAGGAALAPPAEAPRALNVDPLAPAVPGAPPLGRVAEAWRVRVDFWPAPGLETGAAVRPAEIAEYAYHRVGHVRLGDLRARCEADCSLESLRIALRAAAGSVGATSLVGVRCIQQEQAPSCIASASRLASEPAGEVR